MSLLCYIYMYDDELKLFFGIKSGIPLGYMYNVCIESLSDMGNEKSEEGTIKDPV